MKKLISLCICVSAILTMFQSVKAENTETELSKAERFVVGAGIMDKEYNPDDVVTRAEFADILVKTLRLGDENHDEELWFGNVFGEDTTQKEMTIGSNVFDDVDASHPYNYQIQLVKQHGIMKGVSANLFAPEYSITVKEVEKVLLELMGYGIHAEFQGGYPAGYIAVAESSGLSSGVKAANEVATRKDIAKLIYNALDIYLIEVTDWQNKEFAESDKTFMTGVMKLGKVKGIVTDNGYTSIDDESKIKKGELTVNGITAALPERLSEASGYLGRKVEMYYYTDEYEENVVVYIETQDDDSVITFDVDEFESYKDGVITFYKNNKLYRKAVDEEVEMIINNEVCNYFNEATFDFEDGDITLIEGDSKVSLIIANKYEYAVVSNVDENNSFIYNKLLGKNSLSKYDLSGNGIDEESIFIKNEKGEKITLKDISVNDILNIKRSSDYMEIVRTNDVVTDFLVTGIVSDEDKTIYSGGESKYISSEYMEKLDNKPDVNIKKTYKLYLNMFGNIIWMENIDDLGTAPNVGILTDAKFLPDEEDAYQRMIRIYTTDSELVRFYLPEKIRLNGELKKFENVVDKISEAIGEAILYKFNEEKVITEITIANEYGSTKEIGWFKLAPEIELTYESQGGALGTMIYVDKNTTKIFTVPKDQALFTEAENFSINKATFTDNGKFIVEAYGKDPYSVTADAIVLKREAAKGGTIKEAMGYLITDIENTINADDEPIVRFSGYIFQNGKAATYAEFNVDEEAVMVTFGSGGIGQPIPQDGKVEEVGPRTFRELTPGDIIYYNTNINDEIETIRIAYDMSTGKAFNAGRGNDFYDPKNAGQYASPTNTTWAGTAISRVGDGVRLAINKNPAAINFNDFNDVKNNVAAVRLKNTSAIMVVEKNGKKLNVRTGTINDVITYNETRGVEDADEVVSLAYWRSGNYATVIYK